MDIDKTYHDILSYLDSNQYHVTHKTIARNVGITNKQCRFVLRMFFNNMKRHKFLNDRKAYYKRSWVDSGNTRSYIF